MKKNTPPQSSNDEVRAEQRVLHGEINRALRGLQPNQRRVLRVGIGRDIVDPQSGFAEPPQPLPPRINTQDEYAGLQAQ